MKSKRSSRFLGLILAFYGGCGDEPPRQIADAPVEGWATARQFGDDADPEAVVATVGVQSIRVADLALCLEARPVSNVEDCLNQLVEAVLLASDAQEIDIESPSVADARRAALASAMLRDTIERLVTRATLTEQRIQNFIADPGNGPLFQSPAQRQVSHLLVFDGEATGADAREIANRLFEETDWTSVTHVWDLFTVRDRFLVAAGERDVVVRVEEHFLVADNDEQGRALPGFDAYDASFVDALFEIQGAGTVSGLVESQFGFHIILLESVTPARALSTEEADALALHELLQRARYQEMRALLLELDQQTETLMLYDNLQILHQDREQLLRDRSEAVRAAVRPE